MNFESKNSDYSGYSPTSPRKKAFEIRPEGEDLGTDDVLHINQEKIKQASAELDEVIGGLDQKLNRVLKKQEHDYLKGYSIYVKQKEQELRELINKLNEKNTNNSLKDDLIFKLKQTILQLHEGQIKGEKEKTELQEKIKFWTARSDSFH